MRPNSVRGPGLFHDQIRRAIAVEVGRVQRQQRVLKLLAHANRK
jgi:hypothetical protein